MKMWGQVLIIYLLGVLFLIILALNVKSYNQKLETGQIQAKNYAIDQLH